MSTHAPAIATSSSNLSIDTTQWIRWFLYLTLFFIPLSMEFELGGGLGTDLIGEPLLWLLTGVTICLVALKGIPKSAFNTISLIVVLHIMWVAFSSLHAVDMWIGMKYWLAKFWFVVPLMLLPHYVIHEEEHIRTLCKCYIAGLLLAALYFFGMHWQEGFSYVVRSRVGGPIWHNHVNYACCLVLSVPKMFYLFATSQRSDRWIYVGLIGIVFFFVHYAYARIAYLTLMAAVLYFFILRWRLTAIAITMSLLLVVAGSLWLMDDHRYLNYAPDFDKTIVQQDFESKISATAKGEDISAMERVHRWVAGKNMIEKHPWTGVGPSNFYTTYRPYTVFSFETYVSDNPERSGIHSYFLMVLVEQGWMGWIIWMTLLCMLMMRVEREYYHPESKSMRPLLMMIGAVLIMIITMNVVNDLIEVIKIGGVFFLVISFLQLSRMQKVDGNQM